MGRSQPRAVHPGTRPTLTAPDAQTQNVASVTSRRRASGAPAKSIGVAGGGGREGENSALCLFSACPRQGTRGREKSEPFTPAQKIPRRGLVRARA